MNRNLALHRAQGNHIEQNGTTADTVFIHVKKIQGALLVASDNHDLLAQQKRPSLVP